MMSASSKRKVCPAVAASALISLLLILPSFTDAFHDCVESAKDARRRRLRRRTSSSSKIGNACHGGLCVGMKGGPHEGGPASYPVSWDRASMAGTSVRSTTTVPDYPQFTDGITYYIWADLFFGDGGYGRMNQFVPQLILGSALDGSSGPPEYKPKWGKHDTWAFGAHYFFETFNSTTNKVDDHAAYGKLHSTEPGEVLWTEFRLEAGGDGYDVDSPRWILSMGVVDDPIRTSTLVVDRPYMGIGADPSWGADRTYSWAEESYHRMCINACWELYGADDARHLPGSGASYDVEVRQPKPGAFEFLSQWEQDEGTAGGCPSSTVREHHNDTVQHIIWDISVDPSQQSLGQRGRDISASSYNLSWEAWKAAHSDLAASFVSTAEEARRRDIYNENVKLFALHGGSYVLDETAMLTAEEFRERGKALCLSGEAEFESTFSCTVLDVMHSFGDGEIQDTIDYRTTQVTPVKNQGAFGTCWSFGFIETIEGLGVRQGHTLTNVSNQEVIDCCVACRGSAQDASFGFVIEDPTLHGRLATDDAYPYTGPPGNCSSTKVRRRRLAPARVGGCVRVMDDADRTGEPVLAGLAILGPAAFGIDAACLRGYKGGVIANCTEARVDHEVLLVGAGVDEDSGVPFFRAKNSWGAKWGEEGYFRFARKGGQLGMGSVVFATSVAVDSFQPSIDLLHSPSLDTQ